MESVPCTGVVSVDTYYSSCANEAFLAARSRLVRGWWPLLRLCRIQGNIEGRISRLPDDLILQGRDMCRR